MTSSEEQDPIIVRADEVDDAGADISTISSTDASESEFTERIESRRAQDAQPNASPKILANAAPSPPRLQPLSRPILRRDGSAPGPPQQPPPPAPSRVQEETNNSTDSLSLAQLRRIVTDLPKIEPAAYAYEYSESSSFPEELQEWFQYSEQENHILLRAKHTFIQAWEQAHSESPERSDKAVEFTDVREEDRRWFIQCAIRALDSSNSASRLKSLECLSYIALGAWGDTAGIDSPQSAYESLIGEVPEWFISQGPKSKLQLIWILVGIRLLLAEGAVPKLVKVLENSWTSEQFAESDHISITDQTRMRQLEIEHVMTVLYVIVEVTRRRTVNPKGEMKENIDATAAINPSFLSFLARTIAKSRWEESSDSSALPHQKLFLLFWKTSLLLFGSFSDLEVCKELLQASFSGAGNKKQRLMTASPLDYHLFRQEITSKYPAYNPPQPLIPIELENNSMLPPLPNHSSRQVSQDDLQNLVGNNQAAKGSILNQAVHIATPAPSPPPSPAGPGGKGGKKQNYQTNQNFPFLYPPVDIDQDVAKSGGAAPRAMRTAKGRWDENDVPASILEAGQLFASRMRMSRSARQLWEVREKYVKAERGWNEPSEDQSDASDETNFDVESEVRSGLGRPNMKHENTLGATFPAHGTMKSDKETDDSNLQRRLDAVREFYRKSLPDMQSFIIVLFKELFQNVQALILQNGLNGVANGNSEDGGNEGQNRRKANANSSASLHGMANGHVSDIEDGAIPAFESLNEVRGREISSKAVSGILLVLLKWFKISHIMKFEYLTQLLLDANFLPLVLKYFAHQDIDKAVEQRNDREDLDFFFFCRLNSKNPPRSSAQPTLSSSNSSSEDEAAPPPISRHRRSPTYHSPPPTPPPPPARPEVDELGFPTTGDLPHTPLTTYAPRFFLTNINLLRLLQKITKRKAHRALLLVQYKSSTILRKALKIPQPDLRLYTLKLFKSQVPYCGRKWRQTNMRVITAIYLHCRPALRDEWLCGGDVDGVVEEALPLEQAGRSLVHWWHLRNFRDIMEGNAVLGTSRKDDEDSERTSSATTGAGASEEYDFFARELDKLGWGFSGMGLSGYGEGEDEGYVEGALNGAGNEFDGGPLQMEGWT